MTLNQFLAADKTEQMNAFWRTIFISERTDSEFTYSLYALFDFYVEVKVSIKDQKVCRFECFKQPQTRYEVI
ncbi:hypothetical protein [Niabella drilacis]|uniref:Uncharacterized protein n=1 Tax=Niabella drilacis (strain DSM 25811 / CCM 8410 / CCUG 62505 / LMG 26954 / E90) TaxID=1285928 RepID=A0A1G6J8T7_NIADE|nr:hypothetical protein [Niabella drilacis]SDC15208.1 hypothetical protein SAMN04487894_101460 [Niabella drilacis]